MGSENFSPLAAKMRPRKLEEIIGQDHLLKPGSVLNQIASPVSENAVTNPSSVVLWGPPGVGKTTIALVLAKQSQRNFIELSAVSAGVKDVRDAIAAAKAQQQTYGRGSLLFIDEIHRFSKAQQDALLPAVEDGTFLLVAATTENPTFSVNGPLLSRCVIQELNALSDRDLIQLLERALGSPDGFNGEFEATDDALVSIANLASGDARRALVLLEAAISALASSQQDKLTRECVFEVANVAALHYDRNGDQHFDVISAFIKSIRGSDVDASLHYLARMLEAGEDPRFIARRLMISAAEDVGLADPQALVLATAAAQSVALIGMPEARIALGETTIYLALAPKSNSAYLAINAAISDVRNGISEPVPVHLRNSQPASLKTSSYRYPHDEANGVSKQEYVGPKVLQRSYYLAKVFGFEADLAARWSALKSLIRGR